MSAARQGIGAYLALYNRRRPHTALDGQMLDAFYYRRLLALQEAV